jgi:hypothetical protein
MSAGSSGTQTKFVRGHVISDSAHRNKIAQKARSDGVAVAIVWPDAAFTAP